MDDASLSTSFCAEFGGEPTHLSRAPGRVNLIGEHTDYNGLPVLPMAVRREVRVLLRPREDGRIRVRNSRAEFPNVDFELATDIQPDTSGHWGNYVRAAAQELVRRHEVKRGFDALIGSNVPVASGLSSSSALVNAAGLALVGVNGIDMEPLALAALMADAERYTGTRGGGMDQAISMAAREGHAARIRFDPLRMHHVLVPPDWLFVVADTGRRAEKSGPAQRAYNLRRAECEEALERVGTEAVRLGLVPSLPRSYTELLTKLGDEGALMVSESALSGNLFRRFRHVVREARRVDLAVDALTNGDRMRFGMLMDESHGSLRSDFHVSSAELDELVALAKEGGAAGARLTGAGFGGCIVALTAPSTVDDVVAAIHTGYHGPRRVRGDPEDLVFVALPSGGATFSIATDPV